MLRGTIGCVCAAGLVSCLADGTRGRVGTGAFVGAQPDQVASQQDAGGPLPAVGATSHAESPKSRKSDVDCGPTQECGWVDVPPLENVPDYLATLCSSK